MPYLNQDSEKLDYNGLDQAAYYIGATLRKYGRISVLQSKEKYGTVRVYLSFGFDDLHSLMYPGYHYSQNKWMAHIPLTWLNFIVIPLQTKLYRLIYKKAIKKWPHLRERIITEADFPNYLEGL